MSQTSSGARVVFSVNAQRIAFANALNYTVSHDHQSLMVLDQLEPVEYTETAYKVTFTVDMFRVSFRDAISLGLRPRLEDIIYQPELTAELVDEITGVTLMSIERVKCTQETFNIDARSVGNLTLNFSGIKMSTEAGPS